jgi:hypothetical protein
MTNQAKPAVTIGRSPRKGTNLLWDLSSPPFLTPSPMALASLRFDKGDIALAPQVRCSSFSLGSFGEIGATGADAQLRAPVYEGDDRVGQVWLGKSAEIAAQGPTGEGSVAAASAPGAGLSGLGQSRPEPPQVACSFTHEW